MPVLSDFQATAIDSTERNLSDYAGQVVLVVNTASKCGLTPQFEGLQALYDELGPDGFVVLGFPSHQFQQELDSADEIGEFCQVNYGVSFPMFAPIDVNGKHQHPLFRWLKSEQRGTLGKAITWNFTKFLVGRDGTVLARFGSNTVPEDFADDIRAALTAPANAA